MRPVRFLFSAAATAAPQATKETSKAAAAGKPRRAFAPLRIHPWQAQCLGTSRSELLPQGVLYHGTHLGPRPLIILDHTTKSAAEAEEAAKKYEALLSELAWGHGAVYVPLHVDYAGATRDVLDHSCRQVCAVMDALDVRWTHFLAYSYGCLVAARMAASEEFPHRLGTFTSLDTPLVTREQLNNTQRREDIAKAEKDVNVPEADLAFAKHTLLGSLEEPLPCPADADKGVYGEYLFHPASIFRAGGLVRCEERYVPLRQLADVRHPLQLVLPADAALAEAAVHRDLFGLRRPAVVKGCKCHAELFHDTAARDIAGILDAWMHRFEPDAFIAKRYEQAAKEMTQLMSTSAQPSADSESTGASEQRKKKEKKKK